MSEQKDNIMQNNFFWTVHKFIYALKTFLSLVLIFTSTFTIRLYTNLKIQWR